MAYKKLYCDVCKKIVMTIRILRQDACSECNGVIENKMMRPIKVADVLADYYAAKQIAK